MNLTKQEMWISGFNEFIIDTSKQDRILQCRNCNSIEIHNPKFFSLHKQKCKKGCGVEFTGEDLVPLPIKCENCGSQKGFDFTEISGVEEAELINHEMYGYAKASMIDDTIEELDELETEIAENTALVENNPKVKGEFKQQVFTIEPKSGFETSGIVEKDLYHNATVQQTGYHGLVNVGNTPHMQKKIPIEELLAIKHNSIIAVKNALLPSTYGDRLLNAECKLKMGFSIECLNTLESHKKHVDVGIKTCNRKLNDRQVKSILNDIYFTQKKINEIKQQENVNRTGKENEILVTCEEKIARLISVLKTGNKSCGYQSPMYEPKDNKYDPIDLTKLQMETDIPWNEEPMDLMKIARKYQ